MIEIGTSNCLNVSQSLDYQIVNIKVWNISYTAHQKMIGLQ
jgi:hypothetical protein